jgi:thymidylate synthase (FAD)
MMKIELMQATPNPEALIGKLAGICYDKLETSTEEQHVKRAAHCVEKGHLSTLRFAHATFHIAGISRVCSTQILRSKHLDFLQRSQRYCNEGDAKVIKPEMTLYQQTLFMNAGRAAFQTYRELIAAGVKKEDARMILPQCVETEMIVVGNFQAWLDFIKLRCNKESQWEIRAAAQEIKRQLQEIAPNVFA